MSLTVALNVNSIPSPLLAEGVAHFVLSRPTSVSPISIDILDILTHIDRWSMLSKRSFGLALLSLLIMLLPLTAYTPNGFETFTYTISAGTHTVEFKVADAGDDGVDSGLIVDDVDPPPAQPGVVDAIAIWSHKITDYDIYYSVWDDTLGTWSTAGSIDLAWFAANSGDDLFPAIAFDRGGNAIAVWSHGNWPSVQICYSKWDGLTQTWSVLASIPGQTDKNVNPAIALDSTGQGMCIWQRETSLLYSFWDGVAWSPPATLAVGAVGAAVEEAQLGCKQPEIAFDSYDYAMGVWTDGPERKVYYSRWNRSAWSPSAIIPGCLPRERIDENRKGISPDSLGNMMLAYWQNDTFPNWKVYYAGWWGTAWTTALPLTPPTIVGEFNPAVAWGPNHPMAVWSKYDGGVKCDIWFSTFWAPPTAGLGGLFATSTTGISGVVDTNYEWWPAIAFLSSGKAMIVYSTTNYVEGEIYYSLWDPSTMTWSASSTIVPGGLIGDDMVYNSPAIASSSGSPTMPFQAAVKVPLSSVGSSIIGASAGSVYYIYPATAETGGVKDPHVIYASAADWSATGLVLGMSTNAQNIGLDSDGVLCSTADGEPRPEVIGAGKAIVMVTGPIVCAGVHYYEVHGTGSDRAPVYFAYDADNFYFKRSADNTVLASILRSQAGVGTDIFLIEVFTDAIGRTVFIIYGFTYLGTLSASTYFKFTIYPALSTYTQSYYLIRWADAPSGLSHNGIPDIGDTYTPITSG